MVESNGHVSRRSLLQVSTGLLLSVALPPLPARATTFGEQRFIAAPARARLAGADRPETAVWGRDKSSSKSCAKTERRVNLRLVRG